MLLKSLLIFFQVAYVNCIKLIYNDGFSLQTHYETLYANV